MKRIEKLFIALAIILAVACSKENTPPDPTPTDNGFVAKLVEQPRKGHYIYTLDIQKGSQFIESDYTLEVNMNGAKGSLLINGIEYSAQTKIDPYTVNIGYLPFSAGDHNISLIIKSGNQSFTTSIKFQKVTALWRNEVSFVYGTGGTTGLDAGDKTEMLEEKYFKSYVQQGSICITPLNTGSGEEYIYTCFNGIWTGVKVIIEEYVPLEFIIMEVNGIRIDQNTGVVEIEDIARKANCVESNTIKFVDIYPKNASNSNPDVK